MRYFIILYKEIGKYKSGNILKRFITLSKSYNDIGIDAKNALGIFLSCTGTLKEVEVISMQEVDAEGNSIGEPIKPTNDNSIIPTGR